MKSFYDADIDLLEVVETGHKNYGSAISNFLTLFRNEKDKKIVGFSLEGASDHLSLLHSVPHRLRLAGLLKMIRSLENITQEELAKLTGVGHRTLQRAEAGEANITYDNLIDIANTFEKYDFTVLLKADEREPEKPRKRTG